MLDAPARQLIDPPLNAMGRRLAHNGVSANTVTLVGLGLGLLAAVLVAYGATIWALLPLLASRLADGLDGAVARAREKTDFGGYLDIVADFFFYGAVPAAFVFADPAANGAAGAFLLLSFYVNGTSFLGYAALAERYRLISTARGSKSVYFAGGLLEGTETILFLVALCLWPAAFAPMAWVFGALCFLTAGARVIMARQVFDDQNTMGR